MSLALPGCVEARLTDPRRRGGRALGVAKGPSRGDFDDVRFPGKRRGCTGEEPLPVLHDCGFSSEGLTSIDEDRILSDETREGPKIPRGHRCRERELRLTDLLQEIGAPKVAFHDGASRGGNAPGREDKSRATGWHVALRVGCEAQRSSEAARGGERRKPGLQG